MVVCRVVAILVVMMVICTAITPFRRGLTASTVRLSICCSDSRCIGRYACLWLLWLQNYSLSGAVGRSELRMLLRYKHVWVHKSSDAERIIVGPSCVYLLLILLIQVRLVDYHGHLKFV